MPIASALFFDSNPIAVITINVRVLLATIESLAFDLFFFSFYVGLTRKRARSG